MILIYLFLEAIRKTTLPRNSPTYSMLIKMTLIIPLSDASTLNLYLLLKDFGIIQRLSKINAFMLSRMSLALILIIASKMIEKFSSLMAKIGKYLTEKKKIFLDFSKKNKKLLNSNSNQGRKS